MNTFRRRGEHCAAVERRSRMVRTLAAHSVDVARVRREFSHWLQQHYCVDHAQRSDLVLAVNEALINAAEHGRPDRGAGIVVFAAVYDQGAQTLTVTVNNHGRWRLTEAETCTAAGQVALRGRGVALMRSLSDGLWISSSDAGTEVSLVWTDVPSRHPALVLL